MKHLFPKYPIIMLCSSLSRIVLSYEGCQFNKLNGILFHYPSYGISQGIVFREIIIDCILAVSIFLENCAFARPIPIFKYWYFTIKRPMVNITNMNKTKFILANKA